MPVTLGTRPCRRAGWLAAVLCGLLLVAGCATLAPPTPTPSPPPAPTAAPTATLAAASSTPAGPVAQIQDAAQFEQLKSQGKPTLLAVLDRTRT